jgi:DNA-binding LacI/PurR family transcriptional regulator
MPQGSKRQYGILSEVARAAGVSQGTVSKVVHGRRDVGAQTRKRVEELLDAHGYVRPQGQTRRKRVYVVFRDLHSPYTHEIARHIVDSALASGIEPTIGTTEHRAISHWLEACESAGSLGLVLVISMMSDLDQQRVRDQHVPVVLLDPLAEPMAGVSSIGVTNWQGGHDAVRHLIDLGHTRIGAISGRPHSPAGAARMHGYRAALHEAAIEYDRELVRTTDFDYDESIEASLELLGLDEPPTAIFATSDSQALGTLEAARRLGVVVPDMLSVISFDDTTAAATASPPLTAIRQPYDELGQAAIRVLMDLSAGVTVPDRVELATTLSLRQSTAPPSKAAKPKAK